jgi:hypothetical protein
MVGVYGQNKNGRVIPFSNGKRVDDYYLYFDGEKVRHFNLFYKTLGNEWPESYNDIFFEALSRGQYAEVYDEALNADIQASL